MSGILAFPVYLQQPGSGAAGEHVMAMDWFVLINLAFLMFMLGFFACWAWLIWRRTTNPPPHAKLIMELEDEDAASRHDEHASGHAPHAGEPERAPWEREQDWWKK